MTGETGHRTLLAVIGSNLARGPEDALERGRLVTFINPYSYLMARGHPELFARFTLCIDGILFVRVLQALGFGSVPRISFDMTSHAPRVLDMAARGGLGTYFVGTRPENLATAVARFTERFPDLRVVGTRHGYFESAAERTAFAGELAALAPDVVIVGMGTPLQEQFLVELRDRGWAGTGFTCGGFLHQTARTMDYYPRWADRLDLRWLYRMYDEPKLIRRYALEYPRALACLVWDFLRGGRTAK